MQAVAPHRNTLQNFPVSLQESARDSGHPAVGVRKHLAEDPVALRPGESQQARERRTAGHQQKIASGADDLLNELAACCLDFPAKTGVGTLHIVSPKILQGGSGLPKSTKPIAANTPKCWTPLLRRAKCWITLAGHEL